MTAITLIFVFIFVPHCPRTAKILSIVNTNCATTIKAAVEDLMYLITKENGELVEVLDISALVDPCREEMPARYPLEGSGQRAVVVKKTKLSFPSGGALPRCWLEPEY